MTTTDASGRKGRSITNGLGQLVRVDEPVATGGTADADLGAIGTPAQPTIYKYDVFGKMVEVIQGVQYRYFKYDTEDRYGRWGSGMRYCDSFDIVCVIWHGDHGSRSRAVCIM